MRRILSKPLFVITVVIISIMVISPVYLMIKLSISNPREIYTQHPPFLIYKFSLKWWRDVIRYGGVMGPLAKSLRVATLTAFLALLIAAPGAYVIARMPPKIKYPVILSLFFTRMYPEVGIALPLAITFSKMGLKETDIGLVLAHLTLVLPIAAWMLVGTFETIPRDLEEASMIDGASKLGTLRRVVLPLALPGVSVATIYSWLLSWDEAALAVYLAVINQTMPVMMFHRMYRAGWPLIAAYATIMAVPVIIITYVLQKYLKAEYLAGALKG